jgi:signal transduction histidine kinase
MSTDLPSGEQAIRSTLHDLNNLLAVITYSAELAAADLDADIGARAHLDRIVASARSAGELARQLRDLATSR